MIYLFPTNTCFWIACSIDDIKSYDKIYNIKKRSLDKPLAILVADFSWLLKNTSLTQEQVDYLEKYKKPFTILTDCPHLKLWLNYENPENSEAFQNRDIYEKFAFRVAHTKEQEKLTKKIWPLFLTSANYSNSPEIYSYDELEITFWNLIENWKIKYIWEKQDLEKTKSSEVFEFEWESLEKKFLRK